MFGLGVIFSKLILDEKINFLIKYIYIPRKFHDLFCKFVNYNINKILSVVMLVYKFFFFQKKFVKYKR